MKQMWRDPERRSWLVLALIWLWVVAVMLVMYRASIATFRFNDPDDAMRLVQVGDFLAGQGWFDVTQHRANPPFGGPMHWSRLVDLPIAGFILLLRPIFGEPLADLLACVIVPMLTLGALMAALFWAVRRFAGDAIAIVSCLMIAASPSSLIQATPLRIDHHAWQIVCTALMLGGVLRPNARSGGVIAGLAMALWLHISSEGLPLAAVAGAVLGIRYLTNARDWPRVIAYAVSLVGGSVVLLLVTHGWSASFVSYCDAISPVYLGPLALVPTGLFVGHRLVGDSTLVRRVVPLAIAGGSAAGMFLAVGGQCLLGPFRSLDPVVYQFWYKAVLEGLPIWDQSPDMAAIIVVPALLGLVGYAFAWRSESDTDRQRDWLSMAALTLGALIVATMVMRSMAMAHLLALPGNAWLVVTLHRYIRNLKLMLARVLSTVALTLLSPVAVTSVAVAFAPEEEVKPPKPSAAFAPSETAKLNQIKPTVLFAPIDIGPELLVRTPHAIIGTGHHRNRAGMKIVIAAFLADPDKARSIINGTRARYLIAARGTGEKKRYIKAAPNGLMAQLIAGKHPSWLHPVSTIKFKALQLYRIDRPDLDSQPDTF